MTGGGSLNKKSKHPMNGYLPAVPGLPPKINYSFYIYPSYLLKMVAKVAIRELSDIYQ
jgi:hypothetical protein